MVHNSRDNKISIVMPCINLSFPDSCYRSHVRCQTVKCKCIWRHHFGILRFVNARKRDGVQEVIPCSEVKWVFGVCIPSGTCKAVRVSISRFVFSFVWMNFYSCNSQLYKLPDSTYRDLCPKLDGILDLILSLL